MKCPLSGQCGGCQLQDLSYEEQLREKQRFAERQLGQYAPIAPILGMKDPYHYRTKVQAAFGQDRKGNVISGIYSLGSHYLVSVHDCMLEDRVADSILSTIRSLANKLGIPAYDEDLQTGVLRHALIKRSSSTGQVMVVLVTASTYFKGRDLLVEGLVSKHPQIKSIMLNLNTEHTSMVLSDLEEKLLYGKTYIEDELCGLTFTISAKSFYQVNQTQAAVLYRSAIRMARLQSTDKVIDAYCGTGTIGLIAASMSGCSVLGIESSQQAVDNAIHNAQVNRIDNAEFVCADASAYLKELAKAKEKFDAVFLDPPRAGSDERFLAAMLKLEPRQIVYVSCNAETLDRDLRYIISNSSYYVRGIQPVDMFPFSSHVETVVLLGRENVDSHISVKLDADKLNLKSGKATYDDVKAYVREKYGFEVHSAYIGQVKEKLGIRERKNYNVGSGKRPMPTCPPEKEEAIKDAFRHFKMI